MDFSNLPAPSSYEDWKSWAAMLVQQLQTLSGDTAQNFPLWVEDQEKERGGMPAGVDGDLIRVKTEEGATDFRYWDKVSESWQPVADLSGVESQLGSLEESTVSSLAQKLDLDLGNLAEDGRSKITNLSMPNWTRRIHFGTDANWHLVSEDGWAYCYTTNPAGQGAWYDNGLEVSFDGSTKAFDFHYTSYWGFGIFYPVKKGWYIRRNVNSTGAVTTTVEFWPNGDA